MSDDPTARILAAIDKVSVDLTQLRGDLTQLRVDLMARMDRLQDQLALQQDADIVNHGAAERAERIAMGASAEVRAMGEQVSGMVRQIQRLQTDVRQLKGEP